MIPDNVEITPDELAAVNLTIPRAYAMEIAAGQRMSLLAQYQQLIINQQSYRRTQQHSKADQLGAELTRIQMALALLTKLYGKDIEAITALAMEVEAAKTANNRKQYEAV